MTALELEAESHRLAPLLVIALDHVIANAGGERETYEAVLHLAGHIEDELDDSAGQTSASTVAAAVADVVRCACEARDDAAWDLDPVLLRQLLAEALARRN